MAAQRCKDDSERRLDRFYKAFRAAFFWNMDEWIR